MQAGSYPSIYNLGHPAVREIFEHPVVVEEKVDGSQFSFWVDPDTGDPCAKSKKINLNIDSPHDLFSGACQTVLDLHRKGFLLPGYVYRGESIQKPRHNSLEYGRVPRGNIALFDIEVLPHEYATPITKAVTGALMGLEVVPHFFSGVVESQEHLAELLKSQPFLGGSMIEGIVIKAYGVYGADKKTLMAKWVQDAFKELHKVQWKSDNPSQSEFFQAVAARFDNEARYEKALQHLTEEGVIEHSLRDIGKLIAEVRADCLKEGKDAIKDALYTRFIREVSKGWGRGVPEWYKAKLFNLQFDGCPRGTVEPSGEAA